MPNIVMLMSDEHNPFVSSLYGHSMAMTPNMARLAEAGTVYSNAYCSSPLCFPSRSSFMSGRRVHEIQAYSNSNLNVNPDFPSYGSILDQQGIYAVHIGKVDVYNQGENLGFTEMIQPKDRPQPGDMNFGRNPLRIRKGAAERANGFGVRETAFDKDIDKVDTAIAWLSSFGTTLEQPWCLVVNIVNPHFPQWNTEEFWSMYPEGGDLPKYGKECESANHPYAQDLRAHFEADLFTEDQVRGLRRGYLGNVSFVDRQLGRLMDALQELGLSDTTTMMYTSDHGEMLGKFGMWWKGSLYEDSVRVPCIAAGPDYLPGKIVKTPVDLLDIQAAICKSVGAQRPKDWTGVPLQDIADNDPERVVFSEYHGHGTRSGAYMIRKGDWKLIYYMNAPHQLFQLADDPEELHNVYAIHPAKALELEAELRRICSPEKENESAHAFQDEQMRTYESRS